MIPTPSAERLDFIARIVSKALGEETVLEPRLPALFEPATEIRLGRDMEFSEQVERIAAPARDGIVGTAKGGDRNVDLERDRAPPHDDLTQEATAPSPPKRADTPGATPAADPTPLPSLLPLTAPLAVLVPAPRSLFAEPLDANETRGDSRPGTAVDSIAAEVRPLVPMQHGAPRPSTRPRKVSAKIETPFDGTPSPEGGSRDDDSPRRSYIDDGEPNSRRAAQGAVVAPPTTRHRPRQDEARDGHIEANASPVVNVTIGRVEVRAVPPAASTARPNGETRRRQPMSLDEYLKRRGER